LAALLDWPYASLVRKIETKDGKILRIGREIEGGSEEVSDIETPCVLSIQTGINEPRYVGIRGIRKVASQEIPVLNAATLGIAANSIGKAGAKVKRVDYFVPQAGAGAAMLEGSTDELASKLADLLKSKGGLKK
jgi:electron transfer flavoprotein beta subunit